MPKRKIVGLSERLSGIPSLISNNLAKIVTQQGIIDAIEKVRVKAQQEALKSYNANDFQPVIVAKPDATYVAPIEKPVKGSTQTHGKYVGSQSKFINELYDSYYKAVKPNAISDADADRQARFLTQKAAFETGYGLHLANTHNYGGHRKNGKWLSFNSIDDFTKRDVALLDRKWSNWRNAKSESDFVKSITTNNGYGHYAPENEYQGYYGLNKRVNNYIDMGRRKLRCGGKTSRPKTFIGAVIGAFGNVASDYIKGENQKEIVRLQQEAENRRYYGQLASNMSNLLNSRDAQEAYENQFRTIYEKGGRRRLRNTVGITDGGMFINSSTGRLYGPGDKLPVGTYDVLDYTHDEINPSGNTGNGMKAGNKKFEVEKNERVAVRPNSVLVLSDSMKIPTPYGIDTPANASRNGVDNTYVERIQQELNGNYNGDNTRKAIKKVGNSYNKIPRISAMTMRNGGNISLPVERIKAEDGIIIRHGRKYKRVRYPNSDKTYLQDIGPANGAVNTNTVASNTNNRRNNTRQYNYNPGALLPTTRGIAFNNNSLSSFDPEGKIGRYWETIGNQNVEQPNTVVNQTINTDVTSDDSPSRRTVINTGKGRRSVASRGTVPVNSLTPRTLSTPIGPENYYPDDEILKEAYDGATLFEGAEGNTSFDADDTVDTFVPVKERNYNFDWGNLAGGLINGIGGLASGLILNNTLNNSYTPREPAPVIATKLPTTYSIGADLANNNRTIRTMLRDARGNVSSSAGLLSRRNLINLAGNDRSNSLYQTKQREENEMLTRDALNQQQVDMFNAQRRDNYEQLRSQIDAQRNIYKGMNWGNTIDRIVGAYNDYDAQVRQNKADDVAMNWYLSTLPDKDRNWFINQMRGGRNRVTFRR